MTFTSFPPYGLFDIYQARDNISPATDPDNGSGLLVYVDSHTNKCVPAYIRHSATDESFVRELALEYYTVRRVKDLISRAYIPSMVPYSYFNLMEPATDLYEMSSQLPHSYDFHGIDQIARDFGTRNLFVFVATDDDQYEDMWYYSQHFGPEPQSILYPAYPYTTHDGSPYEPRR